MIHNPEFWVAIAFVLGVGILWWRGSSAITGVLDKHAERIRKDIVEARKLRDDAEAMLAEYQRKQRDALTDARDILARAQEDAEHIAKQSEIDLAALLKRREAQATDRIHRAEADAIAEVRGLAVDIAIEATSRLLRQRLDPMRGAALIDQAIQELPQKLH